jgi:hypothetical protein
MSLNTSSLGPAARRVPERGTCKWTGTLRDQDGAAIAAADMTTVTVTIQDAKSGSVLVYQRDVLNANNGTLSAGGEQTVLLTGTDHKLVNPRLAEEVHWVTLDYTWAAGTRRHWHVIELTIVNHPGIG